MYQFYGFLKFQTTDTSIARVRAMTKKRHFEFLNHFPFRMFHTSPPDPKYLFPSCYISHNGMFSRMIGYWLKDLGFENWQSQAIILSSVMTRVHSASYSMAKKDLFNSSKAF